jgi:hypothetical protein
MRYFLLIVFPAFLSACFPSKPRGLSGSQQLEYEEWSNGGKIISFISMKHTAPPQFYKNVQKTISEKKSQGYIVFYEGVKMRSDFDSISLSEKELGYRQYFNGEIREDSLKYLITLAKYKRMLGSRLDSIAYSKHASKGNVAQPGSQAFGLDTNDVNADLSIVQIVQGYEKNFGEIDLIRDDLFLPVQGEVPLHRRLPLDNVLSVILDLRTKILADLIHTSEYKKIVVIYGKMHKDGLFKELVNRDNDWKMIAQFK